jgi:predicted nucleic acid-binding protein
LSVYLDASVLVSLFVDDPLSGRAEASLRDQQVLSIVSDFAAAEFASAIARLVRIGDITPGGARHAFAAFDIWTSRETEKAHTTTIDVGAAATFIRRLDLPLRAPDAIHIAIAQRLGADMFTFDKRMAAAARALGTKVIAR